MRRTRDDLRNVAIVAHVDHGKTTLVDQMLRQTGAFRPGEELTDRVMDSLDLEKEKGITILAKNTSVHYGEVLFNIVDTPGHADFGGEVERGLSMVDGVLLLVDASEGCLPQTRFVLSKALQLDLPVIVVINKVDRSDARIGEVVHEIEELFLELAHHHDHFDFPVVYSIAREGRASLTRPAENETWDAKDLVPLMDLILSHVPPPSYEEGAPLQAQVTNLDASPYVGRLALCRVRNGEIRRGQTVAWCRRDGSIENVKVGELFTTDALAQVPADSAGPGEIVAVAGIAEIFIGETLADATNPVALPVINIDEPSLAMTIGINTAPLAGREGSKMTARLVKNRLDQEIVGNVSIRVLVTERPDAWEVQGRGELQLAVLVETMRREGFELTVGKPRVLTREEDGHILEPFDRLTIDVPDAHLGVVSQLVAERRGRIEHVHHIADWVRIDAVIPARGLIGFRTEFLTQTRGTGVVHQVFERWDRWAGDIRTRGTGSIVSDRIGAATGYALLQLQDRGAMFIEPGTEVYEGMIIGENPRGEDMDVNITRMKKQTNIRSSTADVYEKLTPPRLLTLEQALEFAAEDECVEVTPQSVRLRKEILDQPTRARRRKREKVAAPL